MCITCRQKMNISYLINQLIKLETEVDDSYDFSRWNTTSLSFLYLDLLDERMKDYHYIIENVVDTLKGRTSATTNALEGLKVVEIIERIYNIRDGK